VFVTDYSRVPIVRSRLRVGGEGGIRSSQARTRAEVNAIVESGTYAYCAKLQGFLFFATSYKLLEEIRARHDRLVDDAGRGLEFIVLDFQSVVGVDGSAISAFEKLRRFAKNEGIQVILSDVDRPELARVVTITLYGEKLPTFAFIDRPISLIESRALLPGGGKNAPSQSRTYDVMAAQDLDSDVDTAGAADAEDESSAAAADESEDGQYGGGGLVVQVSELDTALKFVEDVMIARARAAAATAAAAAANAGEEQTSSARSVNAVVSGGGGSVFNSWDDSDDDDAGVVAEEEDAEDVLNDAIADGWNFDLMVASLKLDADDEKVFRAAWRPVAFTEGEVVCERGEVADRVYFIEDAVVKVDMVRGKYSELTSTMDLDDGATEWGVGGVRRVLSHTGPHTTPFAW